ncbi:MAG TPA: phage virion morphogenesis protein [Deinococcales bacterium]|nr:phage virion morphogenesis protein [Deinococcales bacterium]
MGIRGLEKLTDYMLKMQKGETRAALLRIAGETLVSKTAERFSSETDPYGVPWKRSWRANAWGGQTLSKTGRLRRSFSWAPVNTTAVAVGTNVQYAALHQTGGVITPKNGKTLKFRSPAAKGKRGAWVNAKKVTLPARPMLPAHGLPPAYAKALSDAWEAYLKAGAP